MPRINVRHQPFRRWLASLAFAFALGLPAAAVAQVVVVANGSPITAYDIDQRSKLIASSTHKTPPRQQVINDLIDDRLKIARGKDYSLAITDQEVDQAYSNMAARQHITVEQFNGLFARLNISPNTVKARIRAEMTWGQLVRGKFGPSLQVGDSDVAVALRERNESATAGDAVGYLYTLYPVIVVVPRGSPLPIMEAKRKEAEAIRGQFTACKEGLAYVRGMRDVAVREPVTRSSADLPPQFRELLGAMQIGRLTTPEPTAQGMQMFALCDKKETKTDSPIKRELRDKLFNQRYEAESKRFLEEIRKSAMIEYKENK
jgi:peptidyl-prolyl cis-trans isomerase SurA